MNMVLVAALAAALMQDAPPPQQRAPMPAPGEESLDPDYEACIARLGVSIDEARKAAEQWRAEGGGAAALHCQAVADLAGGYPKLAAVRLEELAERSDAGDELVRARILSQAAQAWLEAGQIDLADKALAAAFDKAPGAGELYLTAGELHIAKEEYQAAVDAVTRAEEEGYTSARGYTARAEARMALLQQREAAEDVIAALRLDPFNLDALVLRGELYQLGVEIDASYADRKTGEDVPAPAPDQP